MSLQGKIIIVVLYLLAMGLAMFIAGLAFIAWPTIHEMWSVAGLPGKMLILGVSFIFAGIIAIAGVFGPTRPIPPLPPTPYKPIDKM